MGEERGIERTGRGEKGEVGFVLDMLVIQVDLDMTSGRF
jgi:hypothetical protein